VLGEERPEVERLDLLVVLTEGLPRGTCRQSAVGRGLTRRGRRRLRLAFPRAARRRSATVRRRRCHGQLAFPRTALLDAMTFMSSRHESTKDLAPSSWRRFASATTSTPADANLARTASLSPPSAVSSPPSEP